jgi:hypothetical protein
MKLLHHLIVSLEINSSKQFKVPILTISLVIGLFPTPKSMSIFQRFYGIVYIFYANGVTHVIHVHGLKVRLLG